MFHLRSRNYSIIVTIRQIAGRLPKCRGDAVDKVLNSRQGQCGGARTDPATGERTRVQTQCRRPVVGFPEEAVAHLEVLLSARRAIRFLDGFRPGSRARPSELAGCSSRWLRTMERITVADQLACVRAMAQSSWPGWYFPRSMNKQ